MESDKKEAVYGATARLEHWNALGVDLVIPCNASNNGDCCAYNSSIGLPPFAGGGGLRGMFRAEVDKIDLRTCAEPSKG